MQFTCQCGDANLIEGYLFSIIMQGRILVTGFGPFGEHLSNISGEVAKLLDGEVIRDCLIESLVLPVDESGSRVVSDLLNDNKYQAIMHLGLAEKAEFPRIEMKAKDILDFRIPDNSGRLLRDTKISGKGDLDSTIVPEDWDIAKMIDNPIISQDAGEYLCNETLYRTLLALNDDTPCFFLHLPLSQNDAKGLALQCLDRMLRPACLDVGAGAIIRDGKFLAARRAPSEKHAGWWEFPGGKFETGEDAAACLVREIMEELELEVEVGDSIGLWIFDHGDVVVRLHVMECRVLSGEMKLHVHDKVVWCEGPDEVEWLGPDQEIAEAISAR
jgi:8-oxo-dGTP diphosphatase